MQREEIIAERIVQLDNLYSAIQSLKGKAFILSQMVSLGRLIDPSFLEDFKMTLTDEEGERREYKGLKAIYALIKLVTATEWSYYNEPATYVWDNIASAIIRMDRIRANLLDMLIERGLIKRFREIPIAVAQKEDKEADSYESYPI